MTISSKKQQIYFRTPEWYIEVMLVLIGMEYDGGQTSSINRCIPSRPQHHRPLVGASLAAS